MSSHASWSSTMDQTAASRAVDESLQSVLASRMYLSQDYFPLDNDAELETILPERVAKFVSDFDQGDDSYDVKKFYARLAKDQVLKEIFQAKVLAKHTPAEIFFCETRNLRWKMSVIRAKAGDLEYRLFG